MTSHKLLRNHFIKEGKRMIGSYTAVQREMLALFSIETFSSSTNHSYSGVRLGSPLAGVIDKAGFNSSKRARPAWAGVNLCRQWLWVQLTHVCFVLLICFVMVALPGAAAVPELCPDAAVPGSVAGEPLHGRWGLGAGAPRCSSPRSSSAPLAAPSSCSRQRFHILPAAAFTSRLCLQIMGKLLKFWQEGQAFTSLA